MSEIALRNVCKQFDSEHYGVKDFNLDIHDKEFVIFVGPCLISEHDSLWKYGIRPEDP